MIQLRNRAGTYEAKALRGTVKSRRYHSTEPFMLAVDRLPALKELGTVTGDQPAVPATSRHQPAVIPESDGSARASQVPPSSQRSFWPSWYRAPYVGGVSAYDPAWAAAARAGPTARVSRQASRPRSKRRLLVSW